MPVRHHIDGYAVNRNRDIRAMVGIESSEKDLLRLTASGMLGGNQAGRQLEQIL